MNNALDLASTTSPPLKLPLPSCSSTPEESGEFDEERKVRIQASGVDVDAFSKCSQTSSMAVLGQRMGG